MNVRISGISDKIKPHKLIKEIDRALAICGDPLLDLKYEISEDTTEQIAQPEKAMDRDDGMPCFDCEAFGTVEQCYNKRHSVDANGREGMDCPRIKKMIEGEGA